MDVGNSCLGCRTFFSSNVSSHNKPLSILLLVHNSGMDIFIHRLITCLLIFSFGQFPPAEVTNTDLWKTASNELPFFVQRGFLGVHRTDTFRNNPWMLTVTWENVRFATNNQGLFIISLHLTILSLIFMITCTLKNTLGVPVCAKNKKGARTTLYLLDK